MEHNYFDLTNTSNDLSNLCINKVSQYDCQLMDTSGKTYSGFILAKSSTNKIFTLCDFNTSSIDQKPQARLTFKKTDNEFKTRNVNKGKDSVTISFRKGEDGCREFWQMISFLYKWRETIDLGEFEDFFSITDKSLADALPKIASSENKELVLKALEELSLENLKNINELVSITKIKNIIEIWEENKENYNEEFWQQLFENNTWILSQLFASPFMQIGKKFYCGGKDDDDSGGVKGDLLYKSLTNNLAFIEIKTPKDNILIGNEYRGKNTAAKTNHIYSINGELTGAVNQVLNQKKTYLKQYQEINGKLLNNPKCIVLLGVLPQDDDEQKSFELYRNSLRDVEIVTYDELFKRVKLILEIFES